MATDNYGNIYVASFGKNDDGSEGRIDIFDPEGLFITELEPPFGPMALAIDSEGTLYVVVDKKDVTPTRRQILRYTPCAPYEPETGKIEYCNLPVALAEVVESSIYTGLAINRDNDHLFANFGTPGVREYTSAKEGNAKIRSTPAASWGGGAGVAVDATRDRMYASAGPTEERIDIFDLNSVVGTPPEDKYEKIGSIEDSALPGDFGTQLSVAIDEDTGHVFVLDGGNCNLYEFEEDGTYVATIEFGFQCTYAGQIGIDNGPFSPNGAVNTEETGRYLYVPSHENGIGHSFAFLESKEGPPVVKSLSAANVTENEAELVAQINPGNLPTTYTFEIEEEGKGGAIVIGEGELAAGNLDLEASAVAAGLKAGTKYRFRVFAENEKGSDEAEGSFATYPSPPLEPTPCANLLVRVGPSALLPDCRAYELVTPPDTNARAPLGTAREPGSFVNRQVSPAGNELPFRVEGGSLPGLGGTGSFLGDPYLSARTSTGWTTTYTGPSAAEAASIVPGTSSPDQGYSFWLATGSSGSAVLGGDTSYVRYPDGHSELLGDGSIDDDPGAQGQLISEGGGHIIFSTGSSSVQLEPTAAPDGTRAVYDRTADGTLHVVSLKPGEEPFGAGEHAGYMGASLDGEGIAFEANDTLYLRYENEESFEIGEGVTFAGLAEGGSRIFYLEGGDLKAFDALSEAVTEFSESGDVTPVYVAAGGTAAYFVSPSVLSGGEENPNGDVAEAGEQNLYLSEQGQISFVATVTDRDVEGETGPSETVDGLGLWVAAANPFFPGRFGLVPARATPEGGVLLFKSRAALGDYDPEGHAQIYRYDSLAGELQCLSCNPTGAAAGSDATLQSESREGSALFSNLAWLENLREDGARAFFESSEALVAGDSDGLKDVYEWEAEGIGSCAAPAPQGCLYLISSPHSLRNEYLWAVSESGEDVFFLSSEILVGADVDETPSIYDARVGGGFAEPTPVICVGEGCRPQLAPPPVLPPTLTPALGDGDQFKPRKPRRCAKGKRKVKRAGKVRCVKKKKQRRRQAGGGK